jgi:cell fate regulator YaaT (PSP1 superfamily)
MTELNETNNNPPNENMAVTPQPETSTVSESSVSPEQPVKVVGVRFKRVGRVYYYDPANLDPKVNDWVVVSTPRGQKLGQVVISPDQVLTSELTEPLKPLVRKATEEDLKRAGDLTAKEPVVITEATAMVTKLNLPMKLISAEYNLEGNHLTIFFKSADRVDFRELVKEMNGHFKMRVELRQVGPRDEAKMVGGFGRCGRTLCCATFLDEFAPVSIKMAKQQSLPLNPTKIAGACGRLLCCLAYEAEPGQKKPPKPSVNAEEELPVVGEVSDEIVPDEVKPQPEQ